MYVEVIHWFDLRVLCYTLLIRQLVSEYSAQQHRVPKILPLFPVEYVRNCSTIHFFNSTGTYRNKL